MNPSSVKSDQYQDTLDDGIDIVILWVDGADLEWQKDKAKYSNYGKSKKDILADAHRFRDWNNLQYLFRSIEVFAPWVRKVHFITNGQKPAWLNIDAEKLNFVQHKDYIPAKYLPTFNSCPIELNLHRIEDLSEKFIYFNDDTFITQPLTEEDFFKNNLPLDRIILSPTTSTNPSDTHPHLLLNTVATLNKNFSARHVIRANPAKWLSFRYSLPTLVKSALLMHYKTFPGFQWAHLPIGLLKSTFFEAWEKEPNLMNETSLHKFRDIRDVSQYLIRGWQAVTGKFYPSDLYKTSRNFYNPSKQKKELFKAIRTQKYKMICVNDTEECTDFEATRDGLIESFETILPNKSSFEL